MRKATSVIGPLGQQHRTFAVIIEADLGEFGWVLKPIEIGVNHLSLIHI